MMSTLEWIILAAIFGVFFISATVTVIVLMNRHIWNYKYTLVENIAGSGWIPTKRGRCKLVAFSDGGEEIFFIKGLKKWRVAYGKRIGKNAILWVVGQDGYWYNSTFGDFDIKMRQLGVEPVDKDMRYAYASSRKGIQNRYDKKDFMDKYGTVIAMGIVFLCIVALGIAYYMTASKQAAISSTNLESIKVSKEVMETAKTVLSNIDNIKTGGSGFIQAST